MKLELLLYVANLQKSVEFYHHY